MVEKRRVSGGTLRLLKIQGKYKVKELDVSLKVVDHTVASGYLKLLN